MFEKSPELIAEYERLEAEEKTAYGRFAWRFERFFIRSLRIVCGVALLALSLYSAGQVMQILDEPLPSLTLGMIFKGICFAVIAVWGFFSAFAAAFGEGPSKQQIDDERWRKAASTLAEREAAARYADEQSHSSTTYDVGAAAGKAVKRLFGNRRT